MATQLPATKLYIPPVRPLRSVLSGDEGLRSLVPHPRLIERLNAGLFSARRLTLISAPAGFGKTTLVSEWIAQVLDIGDWTMLQQTNPQSLIPNFQNSRGYRWTKATTTQRVSWLILSLPCPCCPQSQ